MENVLKVKSYNSRMEKDLNGKSFYVLSFGPSCHLKLTENAMAIIELMDGNFTNTEIVHTLNAHGIRITMNDLEYFISNFLIPNNILVGEENKSIKVNDYKLWFHLPIIESKRFNFLYKILKVMMNKPIVIITLTTITLCVICSAYFLLNYNENFIDKINSLQIILLVYFSMFIHELGHATAAYKYGISVGKMGVGIYLIYFIFFIDMTNTWKLDRKKRMINDLSGIYFQLFLIVPLFIVFLLTNSISLLCSIIIILCVSLMNLIPFLRMDGYWLLTDYLSIQNVRIKAFSSIKHIFIELKKMRNSKLKHEEYTVNKQNMFYGIYSLAYVSATLLMLTFIGISIYKLVMDFDDLWGKFSVLSQYLIQGDVILFLLNLNNLFILILPLIFAILLVASSIRKVIKTSIIKRKAR